MRKGKGIDGIEGKRKRRSGWVGREEGEGEKTWKKVGAFRICWVDKLRPN